ncbi:centrosome-associated protein 350-like isoform X1 [Chiloscyllium plagiosum]|uniref:centrosome-associated protein 350-like isoform X1 n=1 Tax=Chiloscyllium plagiosum TaxID=36176 RepID=UPI001CB7C326|nr:centrosome-associated protein 350-like isoform X1 [Chiloscyllium plagiosum]XP_043551892.1 centrosome-associated protein 350-like isoform X1 [Chiloscyllium plagiosum]XP_043551893.1 centrosome-associated protein 350-like isoform X1 [Chiloscyllium plagiosum]
MTEDEIEEKSFHLLLPSESHRCFNMGKKHSQLDNSDEDILQDQLASIAVKAGIRHLQEANKAAHRERQLILKQQEEVQHMLQTTTKIQERLKSAGESKLVPTRQEQRNAEQLEVENVSKVSPTSSLLQTDMEMWSPSPVSISGSETSSIMQKLKKMCSHMDEK